MSQLKFNFSSLIISKINIYFKAQKCDKGVGKYNSLKYYTYLNLLLNVYT